MTLAVQLPLLAAPVSPALVLGLVTRLAEAEALLAEAWHQIDASLTTAGHLAMRNTRESRGECSWRSCGPGCRATHSILIRIAEHASGERAP